jgi:hypothetical protein
MVEATLELVCFLIEGDFNEAFRVGTDLGSVDEDPSFGSDEGGAVIDDGAVLFSPVGEIREWGGLVQAVWGAAVAQTDVVMGLELDFPGDGGIAGSLGGENCLSLHLERAFEEGGAAP